MQERAAQPGINLKTEDLLNALCVLEGSIKIYWLPSEHC